MGFIRKLVEQVWYRNTNRSADVVKNRLQSVLDSQRAELSKQHPRAYRHLEQETSSACLRTGSAPVVGSSSATTTTSTSSSSSSSSVNTTNTTTAIHSSSSSSSSYTSPGTVNVATLSGVGPKTQAVLKKHRITTVGGLASLDAATCNQLKPAIRNIYSLRQRARDKS